MKLDIKYINLMHILVQGLLLTFIGYKKNETYNFLYYILAVLALLIPFSNHLPRLSFDYWNIINIVHYIIVIPMFLYIAYNGYYQKLSDSEYKNIFIFGINIMIYHSYKLFNRMSTSSI